MQKNIRRIGFAFVVSVILSLLMASISYAESSQIAVHVYGTGERGLVSFKTNEQGFNTPSRGSSAWVEQGTEVTIKAIPNKGYKFVSWLEETDSINYTYEHFSDEAEYTFKVDDSILVEALFDDDVVKKQITKVDINYEKPIVGKKLSDAKITASEGIKVGVYWNKTDSMGNNLSTKQDEIAEEGVFYRPWIGFSCEYGYELSQHVTSVNVNGNKMGFEKEDYYEYAIYNNPLVSAVRENEIITIEFDNFEIPVNGTEYKANLKMPSGVDGSITQQNWKMFNKNMTGTASANENVGFVVSVKLSSGNWAISPVGYLNDKKSDSVKRISDTECEFTWNYTIGYTDKIKIKEQSPETVEYVNGEDIKLFVKATGADSYQWTVFETSGGSGVKQKFSAKEIDGATKSEYTITKADSSLDGKQYRCTLTSDDGTIYSNMFKLKLVEKKAEEPAKTEQPTTQEPEKVVTYEVDFETNGGNKISTVEVKEKEKVTKPIDPKKDGYTFDGWYSDKKLTKAFDFNTVITDDITLYAKWTEAKKEEQPTTKGAERTWSKASKWAEEELDKANELELIPNKLKYADLTANITRAEFAHVAVKLYEKLTGNKAIAVPNNPFIDTADSEVLKAYNLEITKGTSEVTFNPDDLITREQMATMMTRALTKAGIDTKVDLEKATKFADDAEMHDWGKESIYYMSSIEIIKGVGNNTFNVLGNATREQALLISERSAEKFAK